MPSDSKVIHQRTESFYRRLRFVGLVGPLLTLLLLGILSNLGHAQTTTGTTANGLVWSSSNSQITITGFTTALLGAVNISGTINGLPVTSIGSNALYNCTNLTSVTIPSSVTSIGSSAFSYCRGLTAITVDTLNPAYSSVDGILFNKSQTTLIQCPAGKTGGVTIPSTVISIGSSAFAYCKGLTAIAVDTLNPAYSSVDGVLFNTNQTTLIQYPAGKTGGVTIPSTVISIGSSAFAYCKGLTGVTIPSSVTSIGSSAFLYCTGLTGVTIPSSVTSIGSSAFYGCTGLTGVTIPSSVTSIASSAFYGCTGLTGVTIPSSVTSIGSSAFYGCTGLTGVTIPSGVTSIGSSAFSGCTGLTGVTIPSGVTSIGSSAFFGCTGLTGVTIPNSVTSIGTYAFYGCSGLTNVNIPSSVTSIGSSAFSGCTGLTGVTISNSVTSIGNYVFSGCAGLTGVTIPSSVTSIGNYAFSNCTGLTNVTMSNSIISIGDGAFSGCGLTSVNIPNTVSSIGIQAFYSCTSLTNVTIPSSVTSIGSSAFSYCRGLTAITVDTLNPAYSSVDGVLFDKNQTTLIQCPDRKTGGITIPSNVTSIGSSAFSYCKGLTAITVDALNTVYSSVDGVLFNKSQTTLIQCPGRKSGSFTIPSSVTSIGNYVFSGCTSLTNVTIPNSVTSIGTYAFFGCSGLTSVNIPSSVTSIGDYAFYGCSGLTGLTIPISVISIGSSAFSYCKGLTAIAVDTLNPAYSSVDGILFNKSQTTLIQYPAGKTGEVAIPSSVTSIGDYAFNGCTSLTSVNIPNSVTNIGSQAFYSCTSLTNVTIPASVTSIGSFAFSSCTWLTAITVDALNTAYSSVDGVLFDKNQTTLIQCPDGETGGVTIPSTVTNIGSSPFFYCRGLTSITVDALNTVYSSVEGVLFDTNQTTLIRCPAGKIGGMTIPCSVTSIRSDAFQSCTNLTSVTIPASVTSIGNSAFDSCTGLTAITVDALNPAYSSVDGILFNISQTTLIRCPAGKTGEVTIPSTVISIGSSAFSYCKGLTAIAVDTLNPAYSSVDGILFNKSQTTLIQYPAGKTGEVAIPNSVTSIGSSAFNGCSGLTSVIIPSSVTSIRSSAFSFNTSLKNAVFLGNAPTTGSSGFISTASGFTVYYFNGATGFSSPTWTDNSGDSYPAINMGAPSPIAPWLLSKGFAYNADLRSIPNGDGVPLLLAYALNLDPTKNQNRNTPKPIVTGSNLSLTYYAASADVTYTVQTSADLQTWTPLGVTSTGPDANGCYTATIPMTDRRRFMRLVVTH